MTNRREDSAAPPEVGLAGRRQFGLGRLAWWVATSACVFGTVRWMMGPFSDVSPLDPAALLGMILAAVAVIVVSGLIPGAFGRRCLSGRGWRLIAGAALGWAVVAQGALYSRPAPPHHWVPGLVIRKSIQMTAVPACMASVLGGVLMGMNPPRRAPGARAARLGTILAVAGVGVIAVLGFIWQWTIVYLVEIALEGVRIARFDPDRSRPDLWSRAVAALPALGVSASCSLMAGAWLATRMRRPAEPRSPRDRRRSAVTGAAWSVSAGLGVGS